MLTPIDLSEAQESSFLGRTSPLVKLGLAIAWLIGLALTPEPGPPILLAALAIAAGLTIGRVPPRSLARSKTSMSWTRYRMRPPTRRNGGPCFSQRQRSSVRGLRLHRRASCT